MTLKKNTLGILTIIVASLAAPANAMMIIDVTPQYITSYTAGFDPLGMLNFETQLFDPTDIHQINFSMKVSGLDANQDFSSVAFDVVLGAGLIALDFGTGFWNPSTGLFDANGPAPGGVTSHWFINEDGGTNKNDLILIVVSATKPEANNRQYGEEGRPSSDALVDAFGIAETDSRSTLLGSIFVQWNPSEAAVTTVVTNPVTQGPEWLTYANNNSGLGTSENQQEGFMGGEVEFAIPEPGSVVMLALGSLALLNRRQQRAY